MLSCCPPTRAGVHSYGAVPCSVAVGLLFGGCCAHAPTLHTLVIISPILRIVLHTVCMLTRCTTTPHHIGTPHAIYPSMKHNTDHKTTVSRRGTILLPFPCVGLPRKGLPYSFQTGTEYPMYKTITTNKTLVAFHVVTLAGVFSTLVLCILGF